MSARKHGSGAWTRWLMLALTLVWPAAASAQLDPLLMIKRNKPNVTLRRRYVSADAARCRRGLLRPQRLRAMAERRSIRGNPALVSTTATRASLYRRKYINLTPITGSGERFTATRIDIVGDVTSRLTTVLRQDPTGRGARGSGAGTDRQQQRGAFRSHQDEAKQPHLGHRRKHAARQSQRAQPADAHRDRPFREMGNHASDSGRDQRVDYLGADRARSGRDTS